MELRDLRAFVTAVEAGAITRAAERLHLVQSAVSQAIKRLERELDLVLFERRPDGVRPTEAGALLAKHAQLIINAVAHAKRDMTAFRELAQGTVRIGVLHTAVPTVLAPLLRDLGAAFPGLRVEIEEGMAAPLADRIRLGYLDLGIFFLPLDDEGLDVRRLANIDIALLVPPSHPLASRKRVRVAELGDQDWVSFPSANPGREWLESVLASAELKPRALVEVESLGAVKAFVEAGRGLALLPRGAAEVEDRLGVLRLVTLIDPIPQTTLATATKLGEPSPAVQAVSKLLETMAGNSAES